MRFTGRPLEGCFGVDVVDNDQARSLYEYHDFQPLPGNSRRLVMKLSTAAKAIGIDWP